MLIIFGGSFNPPTIAHEKMVNKLLDKFKDTKIIIMPTGDHYQKADLVNFKHRFNMLKLIFKNNKQVLISKFENKKPFLGTISALDKYRKKDSNIYFVMGTDNFKHLNTWIEYERLIETYPFIIFKRGEDLVSNIILRYPNINKNYYVIDFNENISSTEIRNNFKNNTNMLNDKVLNYITKKKLYGVK